MRASVALACVLLLVLSGAITSGAYAQSLDSAEEQLELAEFEEAARILEEIAEHEDAGLDRDGVARLLTLRAVARSALGRDRDAQHDLAALVTVLEGREPGALPSGLQRTFDRLRRQAGEARLRVRLRIRPLGDDEVSARLSIDDDPGDVVRRTELLCRSGGADLASSDSGRVTIRGQTELECEGRAFGPGGWEAGRSTARWRSSETGEITPPPPPPGGIDEVVLWSLVGAGAAVVVATLIGIIAYAAASTGVSGPVWMMRE